MIPRELSDSIESNDLSATVNLASGLRTAVSILRALPEYQRLRDWAEADADTGVADVLYRIIHLATRRADVRFEHPDDVALLAYLHLLSRLDAGLARVVAGEVIESVPTSWWARHFGDYLIREQPLWTAAGTAIVDPQDLVTAAGLESGDRLVAASVYAGGDSVLVREGAPEFTVSSDSTWTDISDPPRVRLAASNSAPPLARVA